MNGSNNHPVEISMHKAAPRLRCAVMIAIAATCAAGASQAQAEVACDAPWMDQGGGFTMTLRRAAQHPGP